MWRTLILRLCFLLLEEQFLVRKYIIFLRGTRTASRNLANLIQIPSSEKIKEIICINPNVDIENTYLIFATENGLVKKSKLSDYQRIKQSGLKAIKIQDGDSLLNVRLSDGKKDVLLCASTGKIIRFSEEDC